ncbi:MAG: hypothetical protein AAGI15_06345 [Pseudomonadota bacterium]
MLAGALWLMLTSSVASAAPPPTSGLQTAALPAANAAERQPFNARWQVNKSYALGVNRYQLDHDTKLTGWRLNDRWYFGRQKGLDSGLTLVWQKQANQVSVSKDGLRLTRRF